MNLQHENTNSKYNYVFKNGLKVRFKDLWYTKINMSQKCMCKGGLFADKTFRIHPPSPTQFLHLPGFYRKT